MTKKTVTVLNQSGIHARPASIIVQSAQKYKSSIWLARDDTKVNAKSILNLLAMGATYMSQLEIIAEGPDEDAAISEIVNLFNDNFQNK